ncbi:MAG: hypothetical protein QN135_10830 [Armatimonadota bacterium]|nr:hypothetical protein [Armatimonadota bacterium]
MANFRGRSVRVFARGAGGNVTPVRSVEGPETRFGTYPPGGLAVGADDSVFVYGGDPFGGTRGCSSSRRVRAETWHPVRLIAGPLTRLRGGGGVAVDRVGSVVVATPDDRVLVFARDASGNVAPVREIYGDLTLLAWPMGVAVDDTLRIYVANYLVSRIIVYAAAANGNVGPERVIEGPDTWLDGPVDIAVDRAGRLYVTNCSAIGDASVTVYAADATGNARPLRRIAGRRAENPCGWLAVRE